jgi:hypothetical protein
VSAVCPYCDKRWPVLDPSDIYGWPFAQTRWLADPCRECQVLFAHNRQYAKATNAALEPEPK